MRDTVLERNRTFYSTMTGSELIKARGVKSPDGRSVRIDETVSTVM